ncbi:MAG: alginate export family protein [Cyanobacteria bacterium P01_H01_bin.150]
MADYYKVTSLKWEQIFVDSAFTLHKEYKLLLILLCSLFCSFPFSAIAQHSYSFKDERAEEDYSFLKDSTNLVWQETIKYIPLSANRNSYLSIGGSFRPRFEHFTNNAWIAENNQNYYTQRLAFHTDVHLGKHVRLFGELQHGYSTEGKTFLQTDILDVHQGFIEFKTANTNSFTFRFGRQEMKLGVGRLIDLRVGPNVRRAFDMGKVTFSKEQLTIDAFYGKEAEVNFNTFDNNFTLFEEGAATPRLWGIYSQFLTRKSDGVNASLELYYLGFQSDFSAYSDVAGEEIRHSLGVRSFGSIDQRFQFNTEFIYQFGDLAGNSISAFNFETDWKYIISFENWRPIIGLKLDWSSGDREVGDGNLNSFNPMFVNPATYSLAAVNTPVNLLSFHPSLLLFPSKKWLINLEYAFFYRANELDGFYSPSRIQTRMANGLSERHIGDVVGVFIQYTHNQYLSFDIRSSYFIPAKFIEVSGDSAPIFQFASTATLTF